MALIEINKNPSNKELNVFGVLFLVFFGIIGFVVWRWTESLAVPQIIWGVAGAIVVVYFAVPPTRKPIYLGWIYLAYPIGFTVTHVLMGIIYYLLIAPFGQVMGLAGRDPMRRKLDRSASSYWETHAPTTDPRRYFQQF